MNIGKKIMKCVLVAFLVVTMLPTMNLKADTNVEVQQGADTTITTVNFTNSNRGNGLNQIDFKGNWEYEHNIAPEYKEDGFYRLGYDANNVNHGFNFKFEGNKVEFYGVTEPIGGKLSVRVDGEVKGEFDYYSSTKKHQQKVITVDGLADGVHTLEARFVGKNASSTGYGCYVDFAKVYKNKSLYEGVYTLEVGSSYQLPFNLPEQFTWASDDACVTVNNGAVSAVSVGEAIVTATKEQEQYKYKITVAPKAKYDVVKINDNTLGTGLNQFHYIGEWGRDENLDVLYQRDGRWTSTTISPDTCGYEMKFKGDKISVYGNFEPNLGIADFYIDGKLVATKDLYHQGSKLYQQLQFESTLLDPNAEHTLKVMMTGEKNQAAGGNAGYVDYVAIATKAVDVYPTEIALPETLTIEVGDEKALPITFTPTNTNVKELTWQVANPDILRIVDDKAVAEKAGSTTVTVQAKTADGTVVTSNACTITVKEGNLYFHGSYGTTNKTYFKNMYDELKAQDPVMENQVTGWKGDRVYSEIVLLTRGKEYTNVQVKASDFSNANNDVIAAENMKPAFLKYTKAARNGSAGPNGILTPDIIYGDTMTLEKSTVAPIWVEMNIPQSAKPGMYTGTISVCDQDGNELISFTQTIEVIDLVQPSITEPGSFYLELWNYVQSSARYYHVELLSEQHLAILKPHLQQYRDNAGKTVMATICEEPWNHQTYDDSPSMVKWTKKADGTFAFDFTLFDKYAQFVFDNNLAENISCYSIVPWGNKVAYFDEALNRQSSKSYVVGSEEWRTVWGSFLTSFKDHLDAHGWFDHVWMAMDERGESDMQHAIDLIHTVKNKDGHVFKISGAFNRVIPNIWEQMYHVSPNINSVINYGVERFRNLADTRKEEGLITTMYTCTGNRPNLYNLYDPCEAAWTIWMGENFHTDGYMRWAYDAWVEDPLTDASHRLFETGDVQMVYPGDREDVAAGKVPVTRSAPRTERLFEAIRDVQKLRYLKESNPAMAQEIDRFIDGIRNFNGSSDTVAIAQEMDRVKNQVMQFSKDYLTGNRVGNTATNATLQDAVENDTRVNINDGNLASAWQANAQTEAKQATFLFDQERDIHTVVLFVEKNTDVHAWNVYMVDGQNRKVPVYDFVKQTGITEREQKYDVYQASFIGISKGFHVEVKEGNAVNLYELMTFERDLTMLDKTKMSITASTQETQAESGQASNMIDGNVGTIWHSAYMGGNAPLPFTITLDLGATYPLDKVEFVPRQNGTNGIVKKYDLYIATEADAYTKVVRDGIWEANAETKTVMMNDQKARYVKLVIKDANGGFGSMAEINVYKKANPEQMAITRAEQYVVAAEESKTQTTINRAKEMIAFLQESQAKQDLMTRLEAIVLPIEVTSYSISLKGNIAMNFYLTLSDEVLNNKEAYVDVFVEGKQAQRVMVSELKNAAIVHDGKTLYRFMVEVNAPQMCDQITFVAHTGAKETYTFGAYCVQDYAKAILQGNYASEVVAVVKAMLNYGAQTQLYFNHNADTLANAILPAEEQQITISDSVFDAYKASVEGQVAGITHKGTSVLVTSKTAMTHYFAVENGKDISSYTFTVNGQTVTPNAKDGYYYIDILDIYAKKLHADYTVVISDDKASMTIVCSVFDYANKVVHGPYDETLKNVVRSMYAYNQSAIAYAESVKK